MSVWKGCIISLHWVEPFTLTGIYSHFPLDVMSSALKSLPSRKMNGEEMEPEYYSLGAGVLLGSSQCCLSCK